MPDGKPNMLILWGDDIGWFNISFNIDKLIAQMNKAQDGSMH